MGGGGGIPTQKRQAAVKKGAGKKKGDWMATHVQGRVDVIPWAQRIPERIERLIFSKLGRENSSQSGEHAGEDSSQNSGHNRLREIVVDREAQVAHLFQPVLTAGPHVRIVASNSLGDLAQDLVPRVSPGHVLLLL